MADDDPGRASLRGDPGASPGTQPGGRRVENDRYPPGQARRRQPATATHRKATVRVVGATRHGRLTPWRPGEGARDLRCGDRFAPGEVDRARAARYRSGRPCRLRAAGVPERADQVPQDRGQHPSGAAPNDRAGGARPTPRRVRNRPSLSVRSRRLLRPPQLPHPRLEARPDHGRDHTDPPHLRPPPHPSLPSRSVPASRPTISPATWAPA